MEGEMMDGQLVDEDENHLQSSRLTLFTPAASTHRKHGELPCSQ